ncbi:hypothetical protein LXL04_033474 [Taraxacum kok-saghyz]
MPCHLLSPRNRHKFPKRFSLKSCFRLESEFIEEIVKEIYRRLHVPLRSDLPLLIGMDYSIEFVTSWLKGESLHKSDVLTILGMGGIGKTSLAKYIYRLHCHEFQRSSYTEDISRRCAEKFNGFLDLQKQLCDDISKTSPIPFHDVSGYTSQIENVVARRKVFLVLDDIDSLDQLDALLGNKGFLPGSKIIITTKDAWLTKSCALFKIHVKPMHTNHYIEGLCETESLKLLCFHAFMCNNPNNGYEEVSEKLAKYCQGHPLALEVLGKSLHNRNVAYWKDCIKGLNKENSSPINNVLSMSFDSLSSKNDKELFKHIVCFFVGMDKDEAEIILNACDINTRSGITNLVDRCLISIGENNKLMMHQLLQEMGRSLVRQESPDKPWERSRLWCHEESFKVLKRKKCKGNLLGLALDVRMLEKGKVLASFELKTKAMSKMDNLMLLQLSYVKIKGSYENFPEELRWLCMHDFSLKSIPSDLRMDNLVSLDMSYSNIESIAICYSNSRPGKRQKLIGSCSKDKRFLGSLKILNLSFCKQLRNLCGFEGLPVLERLIVRNCIGLVEVCESIKQCVELVLIDLSYCHKLEKLPTTISMLKKVQKILLDGCNLGESRIEIRDIDSSEVLKAKNICRDTKTTSSTILETIPNYLKIFTCSLPRSLVRLSLENNNLSTESFPVDFSCLSMLKQLYLDDNPIVSLPNCVKSLPSIEILSMVDCAMLMAVEHPPHTLRHLMIYPYRKQLPKTLLQRVVFDPEMTPLTLMFDMEMLAPSSYEFEGMVKVQPIKGVEVNLLHSLGWTNIDDIGDKRVGTDFWSRGSEESEIQMYYEFGIFSTIYGGENIPNWVIHRSKGSSISFIIPSSPNNLRGLNFCYVQMVLSPNYGFSLPMIVLNNITKNNTRMYHHYIQRAYVDGECLVLLSHWMFGMNEMEIGDHVTVTLTEQYNHGTKECGVGFVYDDGKTDEEEEEVIGYYKSWNHIIDGDLTAFQLTTGEYILDNMRFFLHDNDLHPYNPLSGDYAGFRGRCRPYLMFVFVSYICISFMNIYLPYHAQLLKHCLLITFFVFFIKLFSWSSSYTMKVEDLKVSISLICYFLVLYI